LTWFRQPIETLLIFGKTQLRRVISAYAASCRQATVPQRSGKTFVYHLGLFLLPSDLVPFFSEVHFDFIHFFPGVVLPPGEYKNTRLRFNFASAQKRKLQGQIRWYFGPYWSGDANQFETGLVYKIPPRFSISFNSNQTFARLPQGNFVARVLSSQINYTASPFLSFSNLIQYDTQSRNLGWQSRVRWILEPGNDLFFVYSQGWIQDTSGGYHFTAQDSKVSAKLQYTFRF
jgi:hypothetical protein